MIENSVLDTIAESVERELARLRAARPSLSSRVSRAEDIVVTHLSCRRQRMIRVRVRDDRARFLVSGSEGAVYVVDPASWACYCPDAHRHGKGCKHALACWALWRASARPADKISAGAVGPMVAESVAEGADGASRRVCEARGTYEEWDCPGCFKGQVYDPRSEGGTWVACGGCSGSGLARVFVYPKARRLRGCADCGEHFAGRELFEVGEGHLTFFEGDELCRRCAGRHGVL